MSPKFLIPAIIALGKKIFTPKKKKCTTKDCKAKDDKPELRRQYEDEVKKLRGTADRMKAEGKSSEEIARTLHQARRELGIKYKDLTPPDKLAEIYQRNLEKYGDRLGPSIDTLLKRGKTWDDIIESAARPGGKDLGF